MTSIDIASVQTLLRHDDAVVRDHRVHGVRILPGVVYLDGLCRIAQASGVEPGQVELRNILFETPVALTETANQRLYFRAEQVDGASRVRISAQREKDGQAAGQEEHIASCTVHAVEGSRPLRQLDIASLGKSADRRESLETVYARTERLGIQHRDFMRTSGTVYQQGDRVVAELSLGEAAMHQREDFFLHPAFLDTATLTPFAGPHVEREADSAYIPMFIHAFRAWGPSSDTVFVETRVGSVTQERDVLEADLWLYDERGTLIAAFERLTVKRVRSQDLIHRLAGRTSEAGHPQRLVEEDRTAATEVLRPAKSRRAAITADLVGIIAALSQRPRTEITADVGFYDLGLESSQLLDIAKTLEGRAGRALYPTLLFEYQTIHALAGYLEAELGDHYRLPSDTNVTGAAPAPPRQEEADEALFFGFDWESEAPLASAPASLRTVLVFEDAGLPVALPSDVQAVRVRRGEHFEATSDAFIITPAAGDLTRLLRQLQAEQRSFSAVLFCWGYAAARASTLGTDSFISSLFLPFRELVRGLAELPSVSEKLFAFLPLDGERSLAHAAALGGLARSAGLEMKHPRVRAMLLDAQSEPMLSDVAEREAALDTPETEVRYIRGVRETRRLKPLLAPVAAPFLRDNGVVLISGGMGGLGRRVARRLASRHRARVILTGRKEASPETEALCAELRALGGEATYVRADVSVAAEARRAVQHAREHFGALHAVIHAAGVLRDGFLRGASPESATAVLEPKVAGAVNLAQAAGDDLELLALFSSLSAVTGNPGQSDYAAANRFLDAFAEESEAQRLRGELRRRTVSINWPLWRDGGMGVSQAHAEALRKSTGLGLLPEEAGLELLEACLAANRAQVAVAWGAPGKLRSHAAFQGARPTPASTQQRIDIAVVGMSGRYPGAEDLDVFWQNLEAGRDSVSEVPPERWRADVYPTGAAPLCRFGGFLSGVDQFDPLFFRIPPGTAAFLDPQERLFLETAYRAVEQAGYQPNDFAAPKNRVGVFVGVMWGDYRLVGADVARQGAPVSTSSLFSSTANRVSYFFDFTGPSMAVDTACSSSLTALHLACGSLARGECDAAIAGGVNLLLHPDKYLLLQQMNMTSSDGRCRSFGAGGDGYVPGEGVGALFLKRLDRALADGDTIHGVIRGTAINHGGRAAGYTVPHPTAQANAIRHALEAADCEPDSIGYIEAHGTGTSLGDPVEVVGLSRAFAGRTRPLPIGSVKSNIGHLEAAAGVAAVTRALLQLRHGRIAPSLHSATPNPGIDFASTPFRVPQVAEPWPRMRSGANEVPRRAGVSSFGAGGSNAHVIVEEFVAPAEAEAPRRRELLILSARSPEQLRRYAERLTRQLRTVDPRAFGDIVWTLQVGRPAREVRLAVVADSAVEAAHLLERHLAGQDGSLHGTATSPGDSRHLRERYVAGDLHGAGALWVRGTDVDWKGLHNRPRRRVPVAGIPFEHKRFWVEAPGCFSEVRRDFEAGLTPVAEALESGSGLLGAYSAAALHQRFRDMGLPDAGQTATVQTLKEQMGVLPRFDRFFDACLEVLQRHGAIERNDTHVRVTSSVRELSELRDTLLAQHPETAPYVRLLDACLAAYPETLRGHRTATSVLFPGASLELTSAIYRGSRAYAFSNDLTARLISTAVGVRTASRPGPIRILEVGAGTGGTSRAVFAALASQGADVEVYYTDVADGFVAHGRETFAQAYPFARFRSLDIEKDPIAQGFEQRSFDIIFAANALHVAADIGEALDRVQQLLAPDGLLVLSEATTNTEVLALTFGLLDGWHRYRDPERRIPHAPLLSAEQWRETLARSGFTRVAVYGPGLSADAAPSQRLLLASHEGQRVQPAAAPIPRALAPVAAAAPSSGHINAAAERAQPESLEREVTAIVAAGLGTGIGDIRPDRSFSEYGVDSLLAVKIVDRLNARFGLDLKPTVLFDHPSVRTLARHAASQGARVDAGQDSSREVRATPPAVIGTPSAQTGQSLDIAIIGMSGRFPGARDYRELWENLCAGRDAVTEVPAERWSVDDHFQPGPPTPRKTYSRWGGYLSDVDRFDPLFFNIVPAEADFMDPQQRLLLEESWKALEDAGLDARRLANSRCGVFIGATAPDYASLIRERGLSGSHHVFTGNSLAILPARVAYFLNLKGPCLATDTACSSSLVALHQACQSLVSGESDLALAGGVSVFTTPEYHLLASSLGMLSPTGKCRSFDDNGDGFVIGEGVGVVVLKPLARALADGDPIRAVIKGSAVNQDGRTNGITAPSARSQQELEAEVYERFGIHPETLGYVETHGTGTRLGDPIELEALTASFRRYTPRRNFCAIGSIKSNIGHPSHAAGIASLIKVVMSLQAGQLPPSLHFETPNRHIDFDATPFFVNTELRDWKQQGLRRAAISSFGFSGTNCHLVVEEHVDARPDPKATTREVLVPLSARTEQSLRTYARELEHFLAARPQTSLHALSATLQLGRVPFEHRTAIIARSVDELRAGLAAVASGTPAKGVHKGAANPDVATEPVSVPSNMDLNAMGAAWATGTDFDFAGLHAEGMPRHIPLPGYAFAQERCWLPDGIGEAPMSQPRSSTKATLEVPTQAIVGVAARLLSVAVEELDLHAPSEELGFDEVTRAALLAQLSQDTGHALEASAFTVGTSLSALAHHFTGALEQQAMAPHDETARLEAAPAAIDDRLVRRAEDFMKRELADAFRLPPGRIRTRTPLQDYGIDSVLIQKFNQQLEAAFGTLPKTLLFEYQTVHALARYLAQHHAERLAAVLEPAGKVAAPARDAGAPLRPAVAPPPQAPRRTPTPRQGPVGGDIAVIGMAGRYPMANDNEAFWENLLAGRDGIVEVPKDRWDHDAYFSEDRDAPGATYARWGGFLSDVDKFDPRFFNISPKEAETMDPQQRLFLETAWAAIEDAGYTPRRIQASAKQRGLKDAGVFAGVIYGEYSFFVDIPIAGYWAVPNRVSYHLGFNGPSFAVDTACSASLTAVHLACESLRRGECAYAIAGGVNVSIHPGKYQLMAQGRFASSDGRCRSFGAGGDGYVPGEGVVALILKPLEDARADGDRIYGVIRASTLNHGGHTHGFTVPNPNAQAELVSEALEQAGVHPRALSYVEAHGTGTALGDPIEVTALTKAYRRHTQDRQYCAIGSAKSNIGHLEAAAGATGIVKALLQLQHETLVPSLHSETVNPAIDFGNSPFYLVRGVRPWPRGAAGDASRPRLASVSSFGAGGSNAHVILEEHMDDAQGIAEAAGAQLVLLSARRDERLTASARNLLHFLRTERGQRTSLADLAWTLMVGREAFEHRLAIVASTHEELMTRLAAFLDGRTLSGIATGVARTHRDSDDLPGETQTDQDYLRNLFEQGHLPRLADFWTQGWLIDWELLRGAHRGRTVSLPAYPFARERYWIVPGEYQRAPRPTQAATERPAPVPAMQLPAQTAPPPVKVSSEDGDLRPRLQAQVIRIFAELTKLPEAELDVDADFLDFGFDSVASVRMLNRLMKLYGARVPATAMQEYTTIRTFVDHIVQAGYIQETSAPAPPPPAQSSQVSAPSTVTGPAHAPEKLTRDSPFPVQHIFITGVTGVLGGKLLHDLLETTDARIACLVRGDDVEKARARIQYFLQTYDPQGRLTEAFRQRVTPLLGDVTLDRFGLAPEAYDRLAAQTDVTFHAAGKTTLVTFYEALAPINVEGTRRVVDFALQTKHRYMVYVSSFSALGDRLNFNHPPFTEKDLDLGQGYDHLPYQETKYQAEKLIREASARGLVWNIFRPGNIMGDGTNGRYPFAEVSVKGVYYDIVKTVIDTGVSMLSPVHWDITPVDYVSAAMVHLALRRPSYRETYHLTNPDVRRYYDVVNSIRDFGYDVRFVPIDEYFRMATERLLRRPGTDAPYESQTLEVFKYGVEIFGKIHYEESSYAACTYTRSILAPVGIHCPTIAELLPIYLQHCIEAGYLPPPGIPINGARVQAR